jgi:hypothetical protein
MLGVRLEVNVALNTRLDARFERKQIKKAQAKVKRMRDAVRGTATVVSSSDYRDSTTVAPSWTGCSMTCVVQADGVPAQKSHQRAMTTPTAKWPWPWMVLPITIDRAQPAEWIVHWDELQTSTAINNAQADALASAMRGEPGAAGGLSGVARLGGATVIDTRLNPGLGDQVLGVLQAQGVDVESLRGQRAEAAASGSGDDDELARLEKLGQLHASGVLTDAECAEQKAKILGSS